MNLKDYVIKSKGCTITINGDLTIPLVRGDRTFVGTIKVAGSGCPVTGTFEFRSARAPAQPADRRAMAVSFDTHDPTTATRMTWHGGGELSEILNEPKTNRELTAAVKTAATPASVDQVVVDALDGAGLNLGRPANVDLSAFALQAGAVHGAGFEYYLNEFRQARGNQFVVMKQALGELRGKGTVSAEEATQLTQVIDAIGTAKTPADAAAQVQRIYDRLKVDVKDKSTSVMLTGIALDSLKRLASESATGDATVQRLDWQRIGGGDLLGGMCGLLLGLALTTYNPIGGAIGAVTGAIIGSVLVATDPQSAI